MKEKLEQINRKNREALINKMQDLECINYETVTQSLPKAITQGLLQLDTSVYVPFDSLTNEAHGIGRYLVYDHPDPENPLSIWAFALGPGQRTSIHGHLYKGTVLVLEGPVSEKYFLPTHEDKARLIRRCDRYRFHCNQDDLTDIYVHQLKRRKALGAGISVTLHFYNMPAHLVSLEGQVVERRNLSRIYNKEKAMDKENLPPYEEEYPQLSF